MRLCTHLASCRIIRERAEPRGLWCAQYSATFIKHAVELESLHHLDESHLAEMGGQGPRCHSTVSLLSLLAKSIIGMGAPRERTEICTGVQIFQSVLE